MAEQKFDINDIKTSKLLDLVPLGIFYKDLEGTYLYCNKTFLKLTAYDKKDIVGIKADKYFVGEDLEIHIENDKKLFKTGKAVSYIFQLTEFKHRKGLSHFQVSKSLVKDSKGKPIGVLGTLLDVTEEMINKERLELALSGADQGIWDWHIPSNTVYYSPRWKAILGYKPNEIEDSFDTWRKLLHPEDLGYAEKYVMDYVGGKIKENLDFEFRMQHKDGHYVTIRSTAMLVKSKDGKPERMIGTHTDFTKRKEMNDSLEKFKRAFEKSSNSKVLVDYVDKRPKIAEVNESFSRIYGYTSKEVIGKEPNSLKSGKHDTKFYKKLWGDVLDPKVGFWMGEVVNKRKDGSFVDVILTINTFFDKKNIPTGFIAVHTDISRIKEAEKKLKEKVDELEEFNSLVVDRELKMIELKEEIKELKKK